MVEPPNDRLGSLDSLLDETGPSDQLAHELFSVVDALDASATLRRVVTDPGTPEQARADFVRGVLNGKVSDQCLDFVAEAVRRRWAGGRTFTSALERQAIRAELQLADRAGQLDDTEDELFRFARLVDSNEGLRGALSERSIDRSRREELVSQLLAGRVTPATETLARRAVGARERSYGHTLESYLNLAAAQKDRVIATVRVARPLTAEQVRRLRAALGRQAGRDIALRIIIEPGLLGGVRVEMGTQVVEGTVSGRLADAHRHFS